MANQKTKAFITGWPVTHSRSPIIHNYWLKKYQLDGIYEKQGFDEQGIKDFFNGLVGSEFLGGNVTIPYKELAFEMADELDEVAQKLGAVNTLWVEQDKVFGTNTDGYGFFANLEDQIPSWGDSLTGKTAVILGAGGASRPIIQGFLDRGFEEIRVVNRTFSRAENLKTHFGDVIVPYGLDDLNEALKNADIFINTTSMGMEGHDEGDPKHALKIELENLSQNAIVYDIIYTPLKTPLLKLADEQGFRTVTGLGMLLHQAVPGFERWFGVRPEVDDQLRDLVLKDLGQ